METQQEQASCDPSTVGESEASLAHRNVGSHFLRKSSTINRSALVITLRLSCFAVPSRFLDDRQMRLELSYPIETRQS